MQRKYAGPLGRLARLLLWSAGEIQLTPTEAKFLILSVRTTLVACQALLEQLSAPEEGTDEKAQEDLPF